MMECVTTFTKSKSYQVELWFYWKQVCTKAIQICVSLNEKIRQLKLYNIINEVDANITFGLLSPYITYYFVS